MLIQNSFIIKYNALCKHYLFLCCESAGKCHAAELHQLWTKTLFILTIWLSKTDF